MLKLKFVECEAIEGSHFEVFKELINQCEGILFFINTDGDIEATFIEKGSEAR
jgi:hypothetical protein